MLFAICISHLAIAIHGIVSGRGTLLNASVCSCSIAHNAVMHNIATDMNILTAHMCARNNVVICIYAFAICISHLAIALLNIAIGTNILSVHKCAKHNVIICIGARLQL